MISCSCIRLGMPYYENSSKRTSISFPDHLRCIVCFQIFTVSKIRTLLYSNKEWLEGDICPECLKVGTEGIKAKMNVVRLLTQLSSNRSQNVSASELAFKLLETSEGDVQFPTFYQWFLKKLEIL